LVREKRYGETLNESIEFADLLENGETLSSVEIDDSGVTITGEAIATGIKTNSQVTCTVTGSGVATFKATTSDGRIYERRVRWLPTDSDIGDYK
jgi:hypothetical protein